MLEVTQINQFQTSQFMHQNAFNTAPCSVDNFHNLASDIHSFIQYIASHTKNELACTNSCKFLVWCTGNWIGIEYLVIFEASQTWSYWERILCSWIVDQSE